MIHIDKIRHFRRYHTNFWYRPAKSWDRCSDKDMLVVSKACINPPFHHILFVGRTEKHKEFPKILPVEASQLFLREIQLYTPLHLRFLAQIRRSFRKETLDFFDVFKSYNKTNSSSSICPSS